MIQKINALMETNMDAVKKITKKKETKQANILRAKTNLQEDLKQITRFSQYVKTCETEIKAAQEKQSKLHAYITDIQELVRSVRGQQTLQITRNNEELIQ
jgi:hypothetical protein